MNKTPNNPVVQQSLTTESVVKENLTSEEISDMGNPITERTPEEKAREYAELRYCQFCRIKDNCNYKNSCNDYNDALETFDTGYHSRDEEVTDLRNALRSSTLMCEQLIENTEKHLEVKLDGFRKVLDKAKQPLNEK